MGNNPSRSAPNSTPQSPASAAPHGSSSQARRDVRRRESIQALSNVKATAAPPSASLESATAHPTSTRSIRPSSRGRAITSPSVVTPPQGFPTTGPRAQDLHGFPITTREHMGSHQSRPSPVAESIPPGPATEPASPVTQPVDVPASSIPDSHGKDSSLPIGAAAGSQEQYSLAASQFARPPRLPLPIEEEVHTPGSPIITPADLSYSSPIDPLDADSILPRKGSVLSQTTVDDDDVSEEGYNVDGGGRPAVPTLIEWREGGEKVYVTGTFAGWDRKFRLHKDGPSKHKDAFSAIIPLFPGTHHLKFLVDGEMTLSKYLPTAVDFGNILVNYTEVSPDDLPQPELPAPEPEMPPEQKSSPRAQVPEGGRPPLTITPTPDIRHAPPSLPTVPEAPAEATKPAPVVQKPPKRYHQEIPRYFADLDAPEDSSRFNRANAAINILPPPPSLPTTLSRSILNSATPMKDDASVLVMPNHTIINHLATSSIKNNVLATSATTRYKNKFLTTIMYKPTSDTGE